MDANRQAVRKVADFASLTLTDDGVRKVLRINPRQRRQVNGLLFGGPKPDEIRVFDQRVRHYALSPTGTPPRVISRIEPIISGPRVTGVSIVEVLVDERGDAQSVRVLRRLRPDVDAAVEAAVKRWRFEPAREGEEPVAVAMTVTVTIK